MEKSQISKPRRISHTQQYDKHNPTQQHTTVGAPEHVIHTNKTSDRTAFSKRKTSGTTVIHSMICVYTYYGRRARRDNKTTRKNIVGLHKHRTTRRAKNKRTETGARFVVSCFSTLVRTTISQTPTHNNKCIKILHTYHVRVVRKCTHRREFLRGATRQKRSRSRSLLKKKKAKTSQAGQNASAKRALTRARALRVI